jgi:hypothetical protein
MILFSVGWDGVGHFGFNGEEVKNGRGEYLDPIGVPL